MSSNSVHPPYLDFDDWKMGLPEKGNRFFISSNDLKQPREQISENEDPGFWIFRSEGGVCGIIPHSVSILLNNKKPHDLFILHHKDQLEIQGIKAQYVEIEKVTLENTHHLVGRRCPLCHKSLEVGNSVIRCPLCGEGYCENCYAEMNGKQCCSRDCNFSPGPL